MARYAFDLTHSSVQFQVRHMVVSKVRGTFDKWEGEIEFDEQDLAKSKVNVTIDVASVNTREPKRDEHLRGADFFDVANHPSLRFQSTRLEKQGDAYRLVGNLTIRGTTKEVALEVEVNGVAKSPWGDERAGFSAKGSVDRRDFGLTYNSLLEAGGVMVGEKVEIIIDIEAVKQANQTQAA